MPLNLIPWSLELCPKRNDLPYSAVLVPSSSAYPVGTRCKHRKRKVHLCRREIYANTLSIFNQLSQRSSRSIPAVAVCPKIHLSHQLLDSPTHRFPKYPSMFHPYHLYQLPVSVCLHIKPSRRMCQVVPTQASCTSKPNFPPQT